MLSLTIIGNLGADAEMRYSTNGSPLLRVNVAANYRTRTPEGEYQDKTEWVRVTLFGNRAEALSPYLLKGTKVYVQGRLEARPWTGNDGALHAGLEIVAGEIELCSSRPAEAGSIAADMQRPPNTVNRQPAGKGSHDDPEALPF